MILFEQITYRNFLSSGNQPTTINFTDEKTNLIIGTNGSGKSTILDALCFVLFNKAFRKITKSQLLNSTNLKDCLVEIQFCIGSKKYKVIRGIKPNIFEIYIDGVFQNQNSASSDQQKFLEESILKLNYKSFTQIVILGSASFIPFMQLSSSNRREVVEDLLDIKIFSSMNSVVKEKIRDVNEKIKEFELKQKMTQEKIEMQNDFIQTIDNNGNEIIKQKKEQISSMDLEIENIIKSNDEKNKIISNDLQPKIEELIDSSKKLKKLSNLKGVLSNKVSITKEENIFFKDNTVCPTCTQNIDENFRLNKIIELESKLNKLVSGYDELKESIKQEEKREKQFYEVSKKINSLNNEISNNSVKISQFNKQKNQLECEIQEVANKIKNRNTERSTLKLLIDEIEKIKEDKIKLKEDISYYNFVYSLMKDGGIKSKIIKKYLPFMNSQIQKYLQMMDFYINFTLDEEFNETVKSPIHEDFSYESFSEGEKMRINLAILFAWRDIARFKNSVNTNLLILDEVFDSSLDFMGTEYFTKIIKYSLDNSNVFVISHKTDELIDKFDKILKFEKIKGFSKVVN